MQKNRQLYSKTICSTLVVLSLFCYCGNKNDHKFQTHSPNEFPVYGPYRLQSLPISKGVKILNPICIALGPNDRIFAANQTGEVYQLIDSDRDGLEDEAALYVDVGDFGLRSPSALAFKGDTIYIATSQEIRAFIDWNSDGKADSSWTFFNEIPYSSHPYEWTTGLKFGKDGWLYCTLSTDSWNAGASPDPKGYRGSLLRISPDGHTSEIMATGIRSVYGMDFNKEGDLFFTDNEGGGNPYEELNLLVSGAFYGHNPQKYPDKIDIMDPIHVLKTEVAPSGIVFNAPDNDFGGTAGELFIAFYGPGERWQRGGVARVKIEKSPDGKYFFAEQAVADIPKLSDLAFGSNGDLYLAHHGISDYWYNPTEEKTGGFYKLSFDPNARPDPLTKRNINPGKIADNVLESGKQLFAYCACSACHNVDNSPELLGPNLMDVGSRLSRSEILEEIKAPSNIIKPSMIGIKITKTNGQVLLGRLISTNEEMVSLMLVGNHVEEIPRVEILKAEEETKSLMYEGLLTGLSDQEIDDLLDYIISLSQTSN